MSNHNDPRVKSHRKSTGLFRAACLLSALFLASSCARMNEQARRDRNLPSAAGKESAMSLKDAYRHDFFVGASLKKSLLVNKDDPLNRLVARQFNSIVTGNVMKWGPFNPRPGTYNLAAPDFFVNFGRDNNMYVVGHVLFWHNQTPKWVFQDADGKPITREALLKRMRDRVRYVAKRYGNRINAWDVVNESIMDNGSLRNSPWTKIIGDDFIEQAFRIAGEELPPDVDLIYNDYSMTGKRKRDAVVKLILDLKTTGLRIDGVGMQGHWSLNSPSPASIEASILAFAKAGVDVHITELDIDVLPRSPMMWSGNADTKLKLAGDPKLDPYKDGLPSEVQQKLADRYADLFRLFIKHRDCIKRVTFWGVTDTYSWLNNWPIKGRTSYPLLFDRDSNPKPAFQAVIDLVNQHSSRK